MFNYNKLWKLLIDKEMNKVALRNAVGITPATLAKLSKNENVSMDVLGRICKELCCNIGEIVDYIPERDSAAIHNSTNENSFEGEN